MRHLLVFATGCLWLSTLGLGVSQAGPGDPIGGDDPGCAPATLNDRKCSDGSLKAFVKAYQAVIKCHIKQADAAFKAGGPADDEVCETSATGQRDATRRKLTRPANVTTTLN